MLFVLAEHTYIYFFNLFIIFSRSGTYETRTLFLAWGDPVGAIPRLSVKHGCIAGELLVLVSTYFYVFPRKPLRANTVALLRKPLLLPQGASSKTNWGEEEVEEIEEEEVEEGEGGEREEWEVVEEEEVEGEEGEEEGEQEKK